VNVIFIYHERRKNCDEPILKCSCTEIELELAVLVDVEGGQPARAEKNPESKAKTEKKRNALLTLGLRFEPGPHWSFKGHWVFSYYCSVLPR